MMSADTLDALDEIAMLNLDHETYGDDLDLDVADDPTVVETLSCDVDVTARFIRVVSFL
jgi:hypothetical protein